MQCDLIHSVGSVVQRVMTADPHRRHGIMRIVRFPKEKFDTPAEFSVF